MADLFMERDAVISECGRYRYLLRRVWDHAKLSPAVLNIMGLEAHTVTTYRRTRK